MRGFDVWLYALDGDVVQPATETFNVNDMNRLCVLGPTVKKS